MSSAAERRRRSIAWPIFALVIVSVVVATAVFFVVTFVGPPPMQPPRGIDSIAQAMATGRQPGDPGPAYTIYTTPAPPVADRGEHSDPRAVAWMAKRLGVTPGDVVAFVPPQPPGMTGAWIGAFRFGVRRADGWHVVENPPLPRFTRWHAVTLLAMLTAIALLSIPAWASARAITRPLRDLARAAAQARAGARLPPLPPARSREVRALSDAVSAMHARLAGHAEGRTTMLAAIAHDLGTPLSRLAFWVEQLPEAARTRASADIDEMRAMIGGALRFARDEGGEHAATRIDLGSLLDSLVEDMAMAGASVTIVAGPRALVRGDSGALRRLFANLLENAVRYGDRGALGWSVADGWVTVTVDDHGPGIDADQVERLFEPFVRGDPSRNRATGGTGLGLAIVRSIAGRHGGSATIRACAHGAQAVVRLPLTA